jgi:MinD-like ATPase involved in chromosome partitioning or flagellar assembly
MIVSQTKIVSVHSYRGGTGKSNITANLAVVLAEHGLKVGMADMDIQSPGIHALFGFEPSSFTYCLNDYLWSRCAVDEAVYPLNDRLESPVSGRLMLLPCSIHPGDIARIIHDGYDVDRLHEGLSAFAEHFELDFLLIDTHPGLGEETLLSIALSDRLLIILRPDRQDYQGTSVTLKVAAQLGVPRMSLCINKAPASLPETSLRRKVEEVYGYPVDAVFYHSDDMMALASDGIFVQRFPEHDLSRQLKDLAGKLLP